MVGASSEAARGSRSHRGPQVAVGQACEWPSRTHRARKKGPAPDSHLSHVSGVLTMAPPLCVIESQARNSKNTQTRVHGPETKLFTRDQASSPAVRRAPHLMTPP